MLPGSASLSPLLEMLLCRPSAFALGTAMHGESVKAFLKQLASESVASLSSLKAALEKDRDFLKEEFKQIVPKAKSAEVDERWPEVVKEITALNG